MTQYDAELRPFAYSPRFEKYPGLPGISERHAADRRNRKVRPCDLLFNGGMRITQEERILVPSPTVPTYDLN